MSESLKCTVEKLGVWVGGLLSGRGLGRSLRFLNVGCRSEV
jgi:hypothetical protein